MRIVLLAVAMAGTTPVVFAAAGDPDVSFSGGIFEIQLGPYAAAALSVSAPADGHVLLGGVSDPKSGSDQWTLVRRNADGLPDGTFGMGTGQVITRVGALNFLGNARGSIYGQAIQGDGKSIAAGNGLAQDGTDVNVHVMRWNADGTRDTTFGENGGVTTSVGTSTVVYATGLSLQKDGKAVVVGWISDPLGEALPFVLRYATAGHLDHSFASGGIFFLPASFPASGQGAANAVTIQPDGKILVGMGLSSTHHPAILRLTSDGQLDPAFGVQGMATSNITCDFAAGVSVQPDDAIVAGCSDASHHGGVFRLLSNGTADTSFNSTGWMNVALDARSIALLPTGQILVTGVDNLGDGKVAVARVTADGRLDDSFSNSAGQTGIVESAGLPGHPVTVNAIKALPDGRFVVAGNVITTNPNNALFVAGRYQGDPLRIRPKDVAFTSLTSVPMSKVQVSNTIRIVALTSGAAVPIEVSGGSYSINGDPFTTLLGYVRNGDRVMVKHTSAATHGTAVTTTLRIGGLSPVESPWLIQGSRAVATFTSTTQ